MPPRLDKPNNNPSNDELVEMMFAGRRDSLLDHRLGKVPTRDEVRECLKVPLPMQHGHNETISSDESDQRGGMRQWDIRELMENEMDELPNIGEEPGILKITLHDIRQASYAIV